MLIIFFIAAVPKDSQRFQQLPCKHESIFMLSPSSRSIAKPAAARHGKPYFLFYFLIDADAKPPKKIQRWACNAVAAAAAASSFIL
ncbi:MAG: hypothetical protein ACKVOM_08020 [Ferruginibacter sp.]